MSAKWYIPFFIVIAIFFIKHPAETNAEENKFIGQETFSDINEAQTDRVIIKFKDQPVQSSLRGMEVEDSQVGNKQTITVNVPEGKSAEELAEKLEEKNDVVFAEPDYLVKSAYTPRDPYYPFQYHHQAIGSEDAWNWASSLKDVTVAVLDDGFDLNHPDLAPNIKSAYDTVTNRTNELPISSHGTHVSGIIAAGMGNAYGGSGVAPNANILAINVFSGEDAYISDVIEGIYYAVANDAKIINMSLGGYEYSSLFNNAIQYAYQQGTVIVAAAGNEATSELHYPSSYENVISVSSTDRFNNRSTFSNYGEAIDIGAPGTSILSTIPENRYAYMSGTSMASPVVAGAAALVWGAEPGLTNDQVAQRILTTAVDLGQPGEDSFYGYGLLNAKAALNVRKLEAPFVNQVSDQDTSVTGYMQVPAVKGRVIVSNGNQTLALGSVNEQGQFSVFISKQAAGTALYVKVVGETGNESAAASIIVTDKTAPAAPTVNEISDSAVQITGKAEPGASVEAKADGKVWKGFADKYSHFMIAIPKQKAGTRVDITAADSYGNKSGKTTAVVKDRTAPDVYMNKMTNKDLVMTGTTEKDAVITVVISKKPYKAAADQNGRFKLSIPVQNAGTLISYIARDLAGNQSKPKTITVVKIAPNKPAVNSVSTFTTLITGKTEAKAEVHIKMGYKTYKTKADAKGNFKLRIAKQKKGTKISILARNASGQISISNITIVK
ncbi:cell wall-associated protease [Peribacillus deserti]|uniref:Cell wall-associated protease n=2 Tax=Peribacillus deserti TaxID=673318 RepID=A0ABS2QCL5_9BACI|nr:cell wall-associated protease [Peribacillus deserti]